MFVACVVDCISVSDKRALSVLDALVRYSLNGESITTVNMTESSAVERKQKDLELAAALLDEEEMEFYELAEQLKCYEENSEDSHAIVDMILLIVKGHCKTQNASGYIV